MGTQGTKLHLTRRELDEHFLDWSCFYDDADMIQIFDEKSRLVDWAGVFGQCLPIIEIPPGQFDHLFDD